MTDAVHKVVNEDVALVVDACPEVSELEGRSLLIVGASSLLASYMAHTVLWLNKHVFKSPCALWVSSRDVQKLKKKFGYAVGDASLHFVVGSECKELMSACPQVDYIVHAASPADPEAYERDPLGTIRCNTRLVDDLISWGMEGDLKGFLYFSSAAIYGATGDDEVPTAEDFVGRVDPLEARSCYSESKRCGETLCLWHWKNNGAPTRMIRPAQTYGPGLSLDDPRVFSAFLKLGLQKRDIEIKGNPNTKRTFCYLGDANIAFWMALLCGENGQAYNVGNDETEMSIEVFANAVARICGVNVILPVTQQKVQGVTERRLLDISKLRQMGFAPRFDVEMGLKRTIASLES